MGKYISDNSDLNVTQFPFKYFRIKFNHSCLTDTVVSQFPADLATFTEEILNGKLHFLCSESPK